VTAILWDFDGTLVETRARNMNVNRRIIEEITGRPWTDFEVMRSEMVYERAQRVSINWREFYRNHFDLDEDAVTRAGARWTPYQLEDETPTPPLDGIAEVLGACDGVPLGVVSQNCSANIAATLARYGIGERFRCIIGYAEVADRQQKPAPDGLLLAIERLTRFAAGSVLYVGDHETDLNTANNANRVLADRGLPVRVVSVAALYGVEGAPEPWVAGADFRATTPMEIVEIARQIDRA
jgi:phosphoglycolate phosphatase-like HAD superfamily hydrolase